MLLIFILFYISKFQYVTSQRSLLPTGCKIDKVKFFWYGFGAEKLISRSHGLRCDVYNGYRFQLNISSNKSEYASLKNIDQIVGIKWPSDFSAILDKQFSILNMFYLFKHILYNQKYSINLYNLKGFDLNIMAEDLIVHRNIDYYIDAEEINFFGCKMNFYDNEKKINTCEDILGSNNSQVLSIFQIYKTMVSDLKTVNGNSIMRLINIQFISSLCPLVFNNSRIPDLQINALANTFYKRNILTFSKLDSSKYMVNSDVKNLYLTDIQEINIDSQFLNPLVFAKLAFFYVRGTIRNIEKEVFKSLENLELLSFDSNSFRKIIHKNGIEWIKSINKDIKINITNPSEIYNKRYHIKIIEIFSLYLIERVSIEDVFPDEDFCVYHDFPFDQLILLIKRTDTILDNKDKKFTCTFLWLVQYYKHYQKSGCFQNELDPNKLQILNYSFHILNVLNNSNYLSSLSKCFFRKMIDLCNKSNYAIKHFINTSDYKEFNEIFKIVLKIISYIVSLFGIITNLLVIITILHKKNKELFKEFKQFSYLWINSLFSLLILVIQIFSWMSECFYPYVVFCPEIRKSIIVQIFKILFKECLINSFRLMCNLTYVAFSFNRISLINKDHGKLVKFFSTIGKKTYIGTCFLISCGFSVIKYFKYEINFDGLESDFPILIENNLVSIYNKKVYNDTLFILNMIYDFFNYVLFEILTSIIDIYMVLRLRRVLDEKFKQSESLIKDAKKLENMKKENEGALKKANKMVILNTTISILFRMPIAFLPIINIYAEFYYKNDSNPLNHRNFDIFYTFLTDSGFYQIIIELSDLLYTFSLSFLLFIYLNFDKKFYEGFKCIFFKAENKK